MPFVNPLKLMATLSQMHQTWEKESKSLDIEGQNREWVKGVVYGINLSMRLVKRYLDDRSQIEKERDR